MPHTLKFFKRDFLHLKRVLRTLSNKISFT
jgi:hypothetical protein